jgi:acyl carrier protein
MSESYDRIAGILADKLGQPPEELRPETTFSDLGLDSLALLELGVIVQELTGAQMDGLRPLSTLAEAAAALDQAQSTETVESGR